MPHPISRRTLRRTLGLGSLGAAGGLAVGCGRRAPLADAATAPLAPTVAIPDDDEVEAGPAAARRCVATADNIEGPFFKAGAPLAGATLEVWHADARGAYDLDGWHLRGRLTTDRAGRWAVHRIVPSLVVAEDGPARDTPGVWGRFDFVLDVA